MQVFVRSKCDHRLSFVLHAIQPFKSTVFHFAVKSTSHPEEDGGDVNSHFNVIRRKVNAQEAEEKRK